MKIVLDCRNEVVIEVLKQAQQIGLVSEGYFFLITSLDAHTLNMDDLKYGGTNFTAFSLIDPSRKEVNSIVRTMVTKQINRNLGRAITFENGGLDTTTALIYDAVTLFSSALHELDMFQVGFYHTIKQNYFNSR